MKRLVKKKIGEIKFALLRPEQIKKISSAKIVTPELYDIDGYPVDGGLMDLRLGAVDPGVRCRTCGGRIKECLGHPGSIDLARSVMHLKYIPLIEIGLQSAGSLPDKFPGLLYMIPGNIGLPDYHSQDYESIYFGMGKINFPTLIQGLHQFLVKCIQAFFIILPSGLVTKAYQSKVLRLQQLKIFTFPYLSG